MIYFVRHGQTEWNKIGRMQGRIDIELNSEGKEQANIVKEKLKGVKFDKVFSSPLKRAKETAQIICNQEIIFDDRLKERFNGELEGKTKNEIEHFPDFNIKLLYRIYVLHLYGDLLCLLLLPRSSRAFCIGQSGR